MKKFKKNSTVIVATVFVLSFVLGIFGPVSAFAESEVSSGSTSNFAVLANAAVTCTGGTITGDVGTFLATPTGAVTQTNCPIIGTVHVGDAAAIQAFNNFLSLYAALTPKPGDVCTVLTGTLDGITLPPGNYCFDAAATLTGVLTLSGPANGIWNFKIGTGGTGALTGTGFSVVMAGGADPCNVTWWVAEAATMTDSNMQGNILAGAAITSTRGTLNGNAWSKADVTITGTAVTGCANVNNVNDEDNNDQCVSRDKNKESDDKDSSSRHDDINSSSEDKSMKADKGKNEDKSMGNDNEHKGCEMVDSSNNS
jgi:Ice-binding-like